MELNHGVESWSGAIECSFELDLEWNGVRFWVFVAVPQDIKHYLLKELVNLYSKLDKNHGPEP